MLTVDVALLLAWLHSRELVSRALTDLLRVPRCAREKRVRLSSSACSRAYPFFFSLSCARGSMKTALSETAEEIDIGENRAMRLLIILFLRYDNVPEGRCISLGEARDRIPIP